MIMYPRMIKMSVLYAKTSVLAFWSVKTFISKGYAMIKDVDDKMAQQRAARAHSARDSFTGFFHSFSEVNPSQGASAALMTRVANIGFCQVTR